VQENTEPQIVAIGASAGGAKALQEFFEALLDKVGAAFVVIMHLDPASQSEMAAMLATNGHAGRAGRRRRQAFGGPCLCHRAKSGAADRGPPYFREPV
jgi:hypothetical protein